MALMLAALSCVQEEASAPVPSDREIGFRVAAAPGTKAPYADGAEYAGTLAVTAEWLSPAGARSEYFVDIPFEKDPSTGVWKPSTPKYWPAEGTLDFTFRTPYPAGSHEYRSATQYRMTVLDNDALQTDYLVGFRGNVARQAAPLAATLRHPQAQIRVGATGPAYDGAANSGITVTGVTLLGCRNGGVCQADRVGDDGASFTWASYSAAKDTPVNATPRNLVASRQEVCPGFLVPAQPAATLRIHYVIHMGLNGDGTPLDHDCHYDYVPATGSTWDAGTVYGYDFDFSLDDIAVTLTVTDWLFAGTHVVEVQGTPDETQDYLRFDVKSPGRILWKTSSLSFTRTVEYSVNGAAWTQAQAAEDGVAIAVQAGDVVKLRGSNAAYGQTDGDGGAYCHFATEGGCTFEAAGDIMSLVVPSGFADVRVLSADAAFRGLFRECEGLLVAPDLPATTLTSRCYGDMFQDCPLLTSAPVLAAAAGTAPARCYDSMFKGCSGLVHAPALRFTKVATYAYASMFEDCISLEEAPELPATTLATYCYKAMFKGCISLATPPALPAATLTSYCYQEMFASCTALRNAPTLASTKLGPGCYSKMFMDCVSLSTVQASLPATALANYCYEYMFQNCTSLAAAPALPAATMKAGSYRYMFYGCTSLSAAPSLPAMTLASSCYEYMFCYCTSLAAAPALPATKLTSYVYRYMFYGCTALTATPDLPATTLGSYCYYGMFYGCTALVDVPAELPAVTAASYCYSYMFAGCTSLTHAPELALETASSCCCYFMFDGCSSLVAGPSVLKPLTLPTQTFYYMFRNCTSMTQAPDILATATTGTYACAAMFYGCRSLVTAPVLRIDVLKRSTYQNVFYGCTGLRDITLLATDISAYTCITNWAYNVPNNAAVHVRTRLPKSAFPSGASGIMTKWTHEQITD